MTTENLLMILKEARDRATYPRPTHLTPEEFKALFYLYHKEPHQ